ncbi:hypothetical protein SRABI133_03659 [Peribacillus simplex]|uniref:Uncharacterized protein n=1 Tax=Peribacillus simplex TaxID=1478 RepID=A0A9W4L1V3_9BACI|nr:hypothetical protein SRABI133_03659 [Peribacillus simplex]
MEIIKFMLIEKLVHHTSMPVDEILLLKKSHINFEKKEITILNENFLIDDKIVWDYILRLCNSIPKTE